MMVVLKLPIAYLVVVVYWAVRAEPRPPEPAVLHAVAEHDPSRPPTRWPLRPRRPRNGPHGAPTRGYMRGRRAGASGARAR